MRHVIHLLVYIILSTVNLLISVETFVRYDVLWLI